MPELDYKPVYDADGTLREEGWYIKGTGIVHNENGPAWIAYFGEHNTYIWGRHGLLHRLDGPAYYRIRVSDGLVFNEEYWINSVRYTKEEFDKFVEGLSSKEEREILGDLSQPFD